MFGRALAKLNNLEKGEEIDMGECLYSKRGLSSLGDFILPIRHLGCNPNSKGFSIRGDAPFRRAQWRTDLDLVQVPFFSSFWFIILNSKNFNKANSSRGGCRDETVKAQRFGVGLAMDELH